MLENHLLYVCELVYTNVYFSAQCGKKRSLTLLMANVGFYIFEQIILMCLSKVDVCQCKSLRIAQHHLCFVHRFGLLSIYLLQVYFFT